MMPLLNDTTDFEPFRPSLMGYNGHLATIWRSLNGSTQWPPHRHLVLDTPDGDFIELDIAETSKSAPTLLILHGLEGSSKRYYVSELAMDAYAEGWNVAAMNFRSCGRHLNKCPRFYHSGETSDLKVVLEWLQNQYSESPLFGVGFSLGGNVLLKSLGEQQTSHPLTAAAAVSVPYDLEYSSYMLSKGFNRIYELKFVRELKAKLDKKRRTQFPELPYVSGSRLYDFDNAITAPLHGFEDALDYYRSCSSKDYLNDIHRPVLAIHSKQDPLCPNEIVPRQTLHQHPMLHPLITEYGGHVGFCSSPPGWVNRQILTFLSEYIQ